MHKIDFLDKTFQVFPLKYLLKSIFLHSDKKKPLVTASENHENNFLCGTILEKKKIEKVQSKKWILDIDDQALS